MRDRTKPGFTLVELLVVIVIIGLLIALLLPSIGAVWNQLLMTQCQVNLANIFKAQSLWRAEHETSQFATGLGWPTAILPYLEGRSSVLRCPARQNRGFEDGAPASYLTLDDIVVKVFKGAGQPLYYEVSMTAPGTPRFPIWKVMERGNNQKEFWFNDYGYIQKKGGNWDIGMLVTFAGGVPVYIEFTQPQGSSGHAWWFFIYVCGELKVELRSGDNGAGKFIDLGGYGTHPSDYAISRGFYEVTGRDVPFPDSKLFFILDYAKSVADYREPMGCDEGWLYLAEEPPDIWNPPIVFEGLSWDDVTALRHFRMANVLFADGHVETLPLRPETAEALAKGKYLRPDSPLWRYGGY